MSHDSDEKSEYKMNKFLKMLVCVCVCDTREGVMDRGKRETERERGRGRERIAFLMKNTENVLFISEELANQDSHVHNRGQIA
jgi:hypothetical protein